MTGPTTGICTSVKRGTDHLTKHSQHHGEIGAEETDHAIQLEYHTANGPAAQDKEDATEEARNAFPLLQFIRNRINMLASTRRG